jgi:hypothetical protein
MIKLYYETRVYLLIFVLLATSCGMEKPRISMIDPKFAVVGQNLTIMGEAFGSEQHESFVTIGGVSPTLSSYLEWSDSKIVVRVPDFGESGLVYVHKRNQKSNPVLFSTLGSLPEFPKSQISYTPVITQIQPASAAIGQLILIQGSGFGVMKDESAVFFSWAAESPPSAPAEDSVLPLIEAQEHTGGYEAWNEREIRVRVYDGAASGIVQVSTPRGKSNAVPFEVSAKPGIKTIKDKRTYAISYSVNVRVENADTPNNIYLWCPIPASTASQLKKETLAGNLKPFVEDYKGTALYRFKDLNTGDDRQLSISYLVDVYGVETRIQSAQVKPYAASPIQKTWTLPSAFVPSNDTVVKELAAAYAGKELNPYLKAAAIYNGLLKNFTIEAAGTGKSIPQAILEKRVGPYEAAILYCALCRAAGIPAIPVAGVICGRTGSAPSHYWVEFWIDDFGWIPVDPALGAGVTPASFDESFKLREGHEEYYFGNIDNQHLAFSHGETTLSQIDARGRATSRELNYALQNIWEEVSGGIEAYSSHWSDVNVTGAYSN